MRRADGTELTVPRRRMALLLAVAVTGSRGVSREKLLGLLWPELDDERGRAALSQGLYALRKDLGAEEALTGTTELKVDPALVSSDRAEFIQAIDEGADEIAVMLYRGPYLDGFYIREAPAFEQQIEEERQHLRSRYTAALERLARREGERGDHAAAMRLWRQRANLDPTDATVAVALMRAQAAAGDKAGALRHAEVYAELLRNSADLPPDPAVLACAAEIRGGHRPRASGHGLPKPAPNAAAVEPMSVTNATSRGPRPVARGPWLLILGTVGALLLTARFLPAGWLRKPEVRRVVAVTEFQDFAGDSLTGPLAELLRTSLANVPGLAVISAERMAAGRVRTPAAGPLDVAEEAGATEALNGALYRRPDGTLRFDLRRVSATDGRVIEAFEVEGSDVFTLTTEATRRLVERYGVRQLDGEITAVSSASLTAIRLYQAGLDAWYRGDARAAYNLFNDAGREDPEFAMAEFYSAWLAPSDSMRGARLDRAHQLAARASLRERLIIDVNRADWHSDPAATVLAESLTTLFPRELSGPLALARARIFQQGDFFGAARIYERELGLDPVGWSGLGRRCDACTLRSGLVWAYIFADSFPAARAEAEAWTRAFPLDPAAWRLAAQVAVLTADSAGWSAARARATTLDPNDDRRHDDFFAALYLGDIARADTLLQRWMSTAHPDQLPDLYWVLSQVRREQGRPRAALAAMAESRRRTGPGLTNEANYLAQTLFDAGEYGRAAALWDSVGHLGTPVPSRAARGWTWAHALMASALAAMGDTAKLLPIADTMRQLSVGSGFIRDRRLHHHVQGLYWATRGDDRKALSEFRESVWSYVAGYTRADLELGRILLRLGQPRDAARVCESGLRAEMSASAQYVSRGELRECAARGWAAAGVADSARVHLTILLRQWSDPEPAWIPRRDSARELLGRLGG